MANDMDSPFNKRPQLVEQGFGIGSNVPIRIMRGFYWQSFRPLQYSSLT